MFGDPLTEVFHVCLHLGGPGGYRRSKGSAAMGTGDEWLGLRAHLGGGERDASGLGTEEGRVVGERL